MKQDFWLEKWNKNDIGFHKSDTHRFLKTHFNKLSVPENSSILVPLCGKSLDIEWFLKKKLNVIGIELSEKAVIDLFLNLKIVPKISEQTNFKVYSSKGIKIFVGDLFELENKMIPLIKTVYDRASLVALPLEMRLKYYQKISELTNNATQILITFSYHKPNNQNPPFSISEDEIKQNYFQYKLELIEEIDVPGGLKGVNAKEQVWFLK